jgi:hypothetical protein
MRLSNASVCASSFSSAVTLELLLCFSVYITHSTCQVVQLTLTDTNATAITQKKYTAISYWQLAGYYYQQEKFTFTFTFTSALSLLCSLCEMLQKNI